MTSREAFEAKVTLKHLKEWGLSSGLLDPHLTRGDNLMTDYGTSNDELREFARLVWQAAIQHARDVAVKACEEQAKEPECPERAIYCADAIKEALNTGATTPGNKGTTPNS